MREIPATWVRPRRRHFHLQAWHARRQDREPREIFVRQLAFHSDRLETGLPTRALDQARLAFGRDFNLIGQRAQQARQIIGLLANDGDTAGLTVRSKRPPETIQDAAALWWGQVETNPILCRRHVKPFMLHNLELEQARNKTAK